MRRGPGVPPGHDGVSTAFGLATVIRGVLVGRLTMTEILDWADLAAWYDTKQGDEGDLWHHDLIDPGLISLVGEVQGRRLLDVGCGNGYLARQFARAGANVVAVDRSAPIVARAKRREMEEPLGIRYYVRDAASLPMLRSGSIDVAYANMMLMDLPNADAVMREVARLLRPGGRFVASICHPCFDVPNASSWIWERKDFATVISRRVGKYREPFDDLIVWKPVDRAEFSVRNWHRPLSWYVRAFWNAGLAVTAADEPDGTARLRERSPQGPSIHEVPLHVVFEARKPPLRPPRSPGRARRN